MSVPCKIEVLPHFRCSSRPGDQGKALRCLALPTSRTAPVSNRQQARNRPRTSFSLNEITVLVLLYLHRKCGRTHSSVGSSRTTPGFPRSGRAAGTGGPARGTAGG